MRIALIVLAATLVLSACGTLGYQDTNAAVDANASCEKGSAHPGDPVAPWCEREQSATWSNDSKDAPVDFSGKKGD